MQASVINLDGTKGDKIDLPSTFQTPPRDDVIERVFWLTFSHKLQPKGRDPMAGKKTSAETYNPPTGRGISRVPRVKGERYPRSGQAGGISGVVKGRLAHPPRSEKRIWLRVNKKESRLARLSAIAFTANVQAVKSRGHVINGVELPIVVSSEIEKVRRTSELISIIKKIGLEEELERLYNGVKRNSGKARRRGRAHAERKGPLLVVVKKENLQKAASSIPGFDVRELRSLSVLDLAPGGVPGRLTVWSEAAIKEMIREEKKVEA